MKFIKRISMIMDGNLGITLTGDSASLGAEAVLAPPFCESYCLKLKIVCNIPSAAVISLAAAL